MKNKLITITFILLAAALLSSCASKEKPPRERSETYVADISSFYVDTFHVYTTVSSGKPKITDFEVTFAPRTNYLFIKGRVGLDIVRIGFAYEDRKLIFEAFQKYLADYENGTIPTGKPNKKNAYNTGTVLVEWGATGLAHRAVPTFITNAQFLEPKKPYFRFLCNAVAEEGRDQIYSPKVGIYISPSQWENIYEVCNQAHLEEMTDEILLEANAF